MVLDRYEYSKIANAKLPNSWQSQMALDELADFLQQNWEQRSVFYEDGEVKSIKSVDTKPTTPKNEKVSIPETKTSLEIPEIVNTDIDKPVIDISKREPKIDDDIMNMEF